MTFEATLLNTRDALAYQSLLVANWRRFPYVLLQKDPGDVFTNASHHDCAKGWVFRANTFERCNSVATAVRKRDGNGFPTIFKALDRAWRLPELVGIDISAFGGSWGRSRAAEAPGGEYVSSG